MEGVRYTSVAGTALEGREAESQAGVDGGRIGRGGGLVGFGIRRPVADTAGTIGRGYRVLRPALTVNKLETGGFQHLSKNFFKGCQILSPTL